MTVGSECQQFFLHQQRNREGHYFMIEKCMRKDNAYKIAIKY